MRKTVLLLPVILLGACTWGITLDEGGKQVRTAWHGDVGACRFLGKVTVSVQDHVGPVNRNDIKVRDELEVLAKNEAGKLHGDTIKPLAEPSEGTQPWNVYQCGSRLRNESDHQVPATGVTTPASAPASNNGTQTFPVKGG